MTLFLLTWAIGVAAIVILALALPCKGCQLRRQRLREAYARWKSARSVD